MGGDALRNWRWGHVIYTVVVYPKMLYRRIVFASGAESAAKSVEERGHERVVESVLLSQHTSDGIEGRRAGQR